MITKILKQFGLKRRSLPNQNNIFQYVAIFSIPIIVWVIFNFLNIIFSHGFPIIFPKSIFTLIPVVFFTVYHEIESDFRKAARDDMRKIVGFIQMNHLQALSEELKVKPEMLTKKYKHKSLLYWARSFNNIEAHAIIIKLLRNKENLI